MKNIYTAKFKTLSEENNAPKIEAALAEITLTEENQEALIDAATKTHDELFINIFFCQYRNKIKWDNNSIISSFIDMFKKLKTTSQEKRIFLFNLMSSTIDFNQITEKQFLDSLAIIVEKKEQIDDWGTDDLVDGYGTDDSVDGYGTDDSVDGYGTDDSVDEWVKDEMIFYIFCKLLVEKAKSMKTSENNSPKFSKDFVINLFKIVAADSRNKIDSMQIFMGEITQYIPAPGQFTRDDRIEILKTLFSNHDNKHSHSFYLDIHNASGKQSIILSAKELQAMLADIKVLPLLQIRDFFLSFNASSYLHLDNFTVKDWVNILVNIGEEKGFTNVFYYTFKSKIPWHQITESQKVNLGEMPTHIVNHYDKLRLHAWRSGVVSCAFACASFVALPVIGSSSVASIVCIVSLAAIALVSGVYSYYQYVQSTSNLSNDFDLSTLKPARAL